MPSLPNGWRVVQDKPDRDPERELSKLRHRFGLTTRRFDRSNALRRLRRWARTVALATLSIAVGLALPFVLMKLLSPWPLMTTIRHVASVLNCDAARAYGLAPARKGQPGYWSWHDADRDRVACDLSGRAEGR